MPPPPDHARLERYVEDAAQAHGIALQLESRAIVAEHYGRLLDAWQIGEGSGLP